MKFNQKLIIAAVAMAIGQTTLAQNTEKQTNEQFLEAINMRESGDLFAAIEMLESLIETQPDYKRAELELAVAYFRATLFEQAQAHAEAVLNDPKTPDAVKDTIAVFLNQMEAEKAAAAENRHMLEGTVGFGFGRDTNANASPADEFVDINGLQFTLSSGSVAQAENYGSVSAQVTHSYQIPGTFDIGSRPVKGLWTTTLAAYRKNYAALGDYTLNVASLQTGIGLFSATNWRAGVNFKYDHIELGGTRLGAFKGINANYSIVEGANQFTVSADLTDQYYDATANKGLNGLKTSATVGVQRQIKPELAISANYTLAKNNAKADNKQYANRKVDIGLYYAVTPQTLVYGQAAYQVFNYNGVEPVYGTQRDDKQRSGAIGFTHSIKTGLFEDWKLNGKLSRYVNDSNISIYEYVRTDTSVELNKNF